MEKEAAKQVVSRLVKGDIEMITACFDEYYFVIPEGVIKPHPVNTRTYNTGDLLPVKGESYEFPSDFNIIDLHLGKVAKIRDEKLEDIIPLDKFEYEDYPALNMMGFAIRLKSMEDFNEFKAQYKAFRLSERDRLAAFANKWFEITGFRSIRYM